MEKQFHMNYASHTKLFYLITFHGYYLENVRSLCEMLWLMVFMKESSEKF